MSRRFRFEPLTPDRWHDFADLFGGEKAQRSIGQIVLGVERRPDREIRHQGLAQPAGRRDSTRQGPNEQYRRRPSPYLYRRVQ